MITKKNVILPSIAKRKCQNCGVTIVFYEPYPCICKNCGVKVYPTKKIEFKDKLVKEMRKK